MRILLTTYRPLLQNMPVASKQDTPKPLGTVVAEYRIEAGSAQAYSVAQGQYIQIIDVEGAQCSDFLAFSSAASTASVTSSASFGSSSVDGYDAGCLERGALEIGAVGLGCQEIDSTVTRTLNGIANPQAGLHGKYFSQTMQPMVEVIQDTCDRHDSFLLACTPRYYEDAGYPGHPSCSDNFNRVLALYGLAPRAGWPAINFFFNTQIDCTGAVVAQESWSRPGDYVLLKAHQNLLCASSACPDDIDAANGWQPTPIHVRIYAANQTFERAIGRRVAPDLPLRLTQESAFTARIRQLTDDLCEYNGFWVPNSFAHQGDQAEYWALRRRAALMDLSALRKFEITGADAFSALQYAFSRNLEKITAGRCAYGCLLSPHGGIIDDGIVFCFSPVHYRYVGNCDTDGDWLRRIAEQKGWQISVENVSDQVHNLALQGPDSREILRPLVRFADSVAGSRDLEDLGYFHFESAKINDIPVLLSRTGYTGELGYELFVHPRYGSQLWDSLMQAGEAKGLLPLGMKALNRARIEAGLLALGYEFDDLTSPYQAGIGWAVAMKKADFIGKAALEAIRQHPPKVAVGLVLQGNEVAAHGQSVYAPKERWRVGHITSATFSPILGASIAIAQIVPEYAQPNTLVEVGLLDGIKRRVSATVGTLAAFDPSKRRVRGS
jgi:aminomethyltransferase